MIVSRWILRGMRNRLENIYGENQNEHIMFNNFLGTTCVKELMWKSTVQPTRLRWRLMRCKRYSSWITKATNTHSDCVIHLSFFRAKFLTRTHFSSTLVRTLPVLLLKVGVVEWHYLYPKFCKNMFSFSKYCIVFSRSPDIHTQRQMEPIASPFRKLGIWLCWEGKSTRTNVLNFCLLVVTEHEFLQNLYEVMSFFFRVKNEIIHFNSETVLFTNITLTHIYLFIYFFLTK
jgi:hypothetical protein